MFGRKDGYVYAYFNWYTHRAATIAEVYEGVVPADVEPVSYRAADGLSIRGT